MRRATTWMLIAMAAATAGCGPAPASRDTAAPFPAADGYVAKVAALPEGQRRGVLFRAIADAGHTCQAITDSRREQDADHAAVWSARCADRSAWLVALGDDGVAQVSEVRPTA